MVVAMVFGWLETMKSAHKKPTIEKKRHEKVDSERFVHKPFVRIVCYECAVQCTDITTININCKLLPITVCARSTAETTFLIHKTITVHHL